MINLNYLNINLDKAKKEHYNFFKCFITKKILGCNCSDKIEAQEICFCKNYEKHNFKYKYQRDLLIKFLIKENRLERLILGTPEELEKLNQEFIQLINNRFGLNSYEDYLKLSTKNRAKQGNKKVHAFFNDLNKIISYKILSTDKDYSSYVLTTNLGVRSCVYCNRTYNITQRKRTKKKGGRLMSPQLDHWLTQSKNPLLQVSFHNLIPSCEICNSRVKNDINFNVKEYFHPYQTNEEHIDFGYRFSFLKKGYQIFFKNASSDKILKTCKELCIDQMYDGHEEELKDLILLRDKYSEKYIDILNKAFPMAGLNNDLVYRLAFGTEFSKVNFHKRPMSKFKYDILKELKIIR